MLVFFLDCVAAVFFSSDVVSSFCRVLFFFLLFLFFLVLLFDGMVFLDFCFWCGFFSLFLKSAVHADLPARRTALACSSSGDALIVVPVFHSRHWTLFLGYAFWMEPTGSDGRVVSRFLCFGMAESVTLVN